MAFALAISAVARDASTWSLWSGWCCKRVFYKQWWVLDSLSSNWTL